MYRAVYLLLLLALPVHAAEFTLTFDKSALAEPFTGRVFVLLLRTEPQPLARGLNWFNPEPCFAVDVKNWKPGEPLTVDDKALATTPLNEVKPGRYFVQAVLDRDLGGLSFSTSAGNVYSKARPIPFDPKVGTPIEVKLDQVYVEPEFKETDVVKLIDLESKLLTKFHGKPMRMKAAAIVPPSFGQEKGKKYPVVYSIPGFSGDHRSLSGLTEARNTNLNGTEAVWVVLDPHCRLGHHVFADSANNGPCGQALIDELIPAIEKKIRGNGKRLVTGHSSGGWSSLWLQVTYPDTFLGCWSTAPDSVDFRDFQRIDIYNPGSNLFTDSTGTIRPLGRRGVLPVLNVKPFSDMEVVMGRGGQLSSFEAVFSPRGQNGQPEKLWDRKTGALRPEIAKAWQKYDIRLVLERNWEKLGPKLKGKIHVYMGELDTFYLDGATRLLKESQALLKSDAVIEMFPNKDHGLIDRALRERMNKEMAAALKE